MLIIFLQIQYDCNFRNVEFLHREYLVTQKSDWKGLKLAVGDAHRECLPFVKRGAIPDGSKTYIHDLREFEVNMWVEGLLKTYNRF